MKRIIKCKVITISVLLILSMIIAYKFYEYIELQKLMDIPISELTEEQKLEDFEVMYDTITQNYPFLELNKRKYGVDWVSRKEEYMERVKKTDNLGSTLNGILIELNNAHTHILDADFMLFALKFYSDADPEIAAAPRTQYVTNVLRQPLTLNRYKIKNSTLKNIDNGYKYQISDNAIVGDIVEGKIASIYIPAMIMPRDKDILLINDYLQKIKDYQALVIDIRGNGGGDSSYWGKFLLPQILERDTTVTNYYLLKKSKFIDNFLKTDSDLDAKKIENLDINDLPSLPSEVMKDFDYYIKNNTIVEIFESSIKFKGNIYLLVDNKVYSAADRFASFIKSSNIATIIGEQTKGGGIGFEPLYKMLPNSGFIMRFSTAMGTTSDGTSNEEHPTMPDYIVENATRIKDILPKYLYKYDDCIQKVLELEDIDVIEN